MFLCPGLTVNLKGKNINNPGMRMIRQKGRRKMKREEGDKDWSVPVY